uniref:Uncharacterized protein n=1 Tax=Triticum urartu TaxID=4572 RepID=A0A8R7UL08_TRIUA
MCYTVNKLEQIIFHFREKRPGPIIDLDNPFQMDPACSPVSLQG